MSSGAMDFLDHGKHKNTFSTRRLPHASQYNALLPGELLTLDYLLTFFMFGRVCFPAAQ